MMIRSLISFVAAALLFMNPALGDKKSANRNWETGKVLDSQEIAGTVDNSENVGNPQGVLGGLREARKRRAAQPQQVFTIDGQKITYTVRLPRGAKLANLTVNGPVEFAVEETTLYLIDDDHKEHKTEIVKKVLRKE